MPHAGTESSPLTTTEADGVPQVRVDEVRVLDGPNLYFARPAIKVILHVPGYLDLKRTEAEALARRLGMRSARPGKRGTALRQRFVMRVIRTVTRRVGTEIGAGRLGVRVRAGQTVEDVVLAFPWVHRTRGRVAGEQVGAVMAGLLDPSRPADAVIEEAAAVIMAAPDGPGPSVITPRVPVASVTGTNGKTTTTRLMAHMCMAAGLTTAWSSTDGVVVMGETKEEGDFSGLPAHAASSRRRASTSAFSRPPGAACSSRAWASRPTTSASSPTSAPTTSACRASTPSTSSPRSRRSSRRSPSPRAGSCSTVTTRASGPCASASRPSRGPSASTRRHRPCGSPSTPAVAASPSSTERSSSSRRTATRTGWSRSSTSR